MTKKFKDVDAVVFDLDGTLISYPIGPFNTDERRRIQELIILVKDRLGKGGMMTYWRVRAKLKDIRDMGVLRLAQRGSADFLEALSYLESSDLRADVEKYGDVFRQTLLDTYLNRVVLYPDVIPCLSALQSDGFRLGLLSNTPSFICETALDRFQIQDFFDTISSTWTFKSFKPDPDIFFNVAQELDAKPERTLFVGDSLACDVQGARNVGAFSAYLIREHNPQEDKEKLTPMPDLVLSSLDELYPIIRKMTLKVRVKRILRSVLNAFSGLG
jgi:HAD superfamily hydrolase (TIGR01509 family)